MTNNIYLDNAATTKTDPRVVEAMLPYFSEIYGNPSGLHKTSLKALEALTKARETVAKILNCTPQEIIFTGSGTESDNLAIFGAIEANQTKEKNHIITSSIEHHAVAYPFEKLKKQGLEVEFLSPDKYGQISPSDFEKAIKSNTLFASFIYANNEIGTINQISKLAKIAKEKGVIFHTDACQAGGALDIDTKNLEIDLMTLNGSKINGPKGTGVLYVRKGIKIAPQILGGSQEFGLRAGTENVPGIIGITKALELAEQEKIQNNERLIKMRDQIINFVLKNIPLTRLNGHPKERLPNNINISFLNTEGESLLLHLDKEGFQVATGSACTSASLEPSHVLTGIGLPKELAHGSLRITLGKETNQENVNKFLNILPNIIKKIRDISAVNFTEKDYPDFF